MAPNIVNESGSWQLQGLGTTPKLTLSRRVGNGIAVHSFNFLSGILFSAVRGRDKKTTFHKA